MSVMEDVARKYRRALRNGTGLHLTPVEMRAFAEHGALEIAAQAEIADLCPARENPTASGNTGSQSAATANRPTSGKSRAIPTSPDLTFTAALGLGMNS